MLIIAVSKKKRTSCHFDIWANCLSGLLYHITTILQNKHKGKSHTMIYFYYGSAFEINVISGVKQYFFYICMIPHKQINLSIFLILDTKPSVQRTDYSIVLTYYIAYIVAIRTCLHAVYL